MSQEDQDIVFLLDRSSDPTQNPALLGSGPGSGKSLAFRHDGASHLLRVAKYELFEVARAAVEVGGQLGHRSPEHAGEIGVAVCIDPAGELGEPAARRMNARSPPMP